MADWLLSYPLPFAIAFCTLTAAIYKFTVCAYKILAYIIKIFEEVKELSRSFSKHLEDCDKEKKNIEEYRRIQIGITENIKHFEKVLDQHHNKIFK